MSIFLPVWKINYSVSAARASGKRLPALRGSTGNPINNWGQISANGFIAGQQRAVLLSPIAPLIRLEGASRKTRLVAGTSYQNFGIHLGTSRLQTAVTFLDGITGSGNIPTFGKNRELSTTLEPRFDSKLASDMLTLTGTANDMVVLQMTYDEQRAQAAGGELGVRLAWRDPADQIWRNAAASDGVAPVFAGNRPYNPTTDLRIGACGIDTTRHSAWAVINRSGEFAVAKTDTVVSGVRLLSLNGLMDFGSESVGSARTSQLFLTNSGDSPLQVDRIICPPGFTGTFSGLIPTGQSRSVTITFTPLEARTYSGNIVVESDRTGGQSDNPVLGIGTGAGIEVSGNLNFGSVPLGKARSRNLRISNTGNAPLIVSGIRFPAGFSGRFSGTIPVGASRVVALKFQPVARKRYAGNLIVLSNRVGGNYYLPASGSSR